MEHAIWRQLRGHSSTTVGIVLATLCDISPGIGPTRKVNLIDFVHFNFKSREWIIGTAGRHQSCCLSFLFLGILRLICRIAFARIWFGLLTGLLFALSYSFKGHCRYQRGSFWHLSFSFVISFVISLLWALLILFHSAYNWDGALLSCLAYARSSGVICIVYCKLEPMALFVFDDTILRLVLSRPRLVWFFRCVLRI